MAIRTDPGGHSGTTPPCPPSCVHLCPSVPIYALKTVLYGSTERYHTLVSVPGSALLYGFLSNGYEDIPLNPAQRDTSLSAAVLALRGKKGRRVRTLNRVVIITYSLLRRSATYS